MDDLTSYMHKKVRIKTKDGREIEGYAVSYDVGIEEGKDYDSIGIDCETYIESVGENEIKSIEVVSE